MCFLFSDSDAQFAVHFEIYEQHCIFEAENLRALNQAVKQQDFKAYLVVSWGGGGAEGWGRSRGEGEGLRGGGGVEGLRGRGPRGGEGGRGVGRG